MKLNNTRNTFVLWRSIFSVYVNESLLSNVQDPAASNHLPVGLLAK